MSRSPTDNAGAAVGTVKSYALGFAASVALTLASFGLVMGGALPRLPLILALFALAVVQLFVQLRYFLHVDRSSAMYWNLMALLFTFFLMFLFVGGSIWIMYGLHERM